jgi:hypothetical protein
MEDLEKVYKTAVCDFNTFPEDITDNITREVKLKLEDNTLLGLYEAFDTFIEMVNDAKKVQ